jgi:Na+-transporting methylmalonyl-CoA/oxaloacetate decarboxylase gamma subunit
MKRMLFMFLLCLALAGCGLGETAVSAAAGAGSQVEQAKEALRTEARVKQQLDAAAALEAQQRQAAEASSQ